MLQEQIQKLRNEGKTYDEIAEILGCARSTVCYHLGKGQKEKNKQRGIKRRKNDPLIQKLERFLTKKARNTVVSNSKFTQIDRILRHKTSDYTKDSDIKSDKRKNWRRSKMLSDRKTD